MKILLDENIPVQLKRYLPEDHEWHTVRELSWQGTKNGKLLKKMIDSEFDALVTMDKNLYKQQNLAGVNLCIIIIKAKDNKILTLQKAIEPLIQIINNTGSGVFEIPIRTF